MTSMKKLTFTNGDQMDAIGLGTWKSDPGEVGAAVKAAVNAGYRHIDCAAIYGNEAEIGQVLKKLIADQVVGREDLWITSKLWNSDHKRDDVLPALKKTLNDLNLEYLDLYLMHWPVALRPDLDGLPEHDGDFLSPEEVPLSETWEAMLEAKELGFIRHAGVSNFSIKKLKKLISDTGKAPEMNQVELHPYLQQNSLLDFCEKNSVKVTAYSPLGSSDRPDQMKKDDEPSLLENSVINKIAEKHSATPAQVLIKWAVERNTAVIPKSTNPGRIRENIESARIDLDEDDHAKIKSLEKPYRYLDGHVFETDGDMYSDIFDET